jgi:hypothetical protein
MESVDFSQQQSLRIAELPEHYLVVGVDGADSWCASPQGRSFASSRMAA